MLWKIAELFTEITIGTKRFDSSINRIKSQLASTQQRMQDMSMAARKALIVLAAQFTYTSAVGSGFEHSMARVKALSGATAEEFLRLSEQAKDLGRVTMFTARQVASGMQMLSLAGFKTNEILAAMPGLLSLAAAGQIDLGEASRVTAIAIRSMSLAASESGKVADILAYGATNATQSFEDLTVALSYSMPISYQLGISLEELTAAIMGLANTGIRASRAGTAIAGALARMTGAAGETTKVLEEFGIITSDVEGKMLNLPDIIDNMNKAFEGLNNVEKTSNIMKAFGLRAGPAMLNLLKLGGDAIRSFEKDLYNAGGTAKKVADTQLDSLRGRLIYLKSAVEGLAIAIYEAMAPALQIIVDRTRELVLSTRQLSTQVMQQIVKWTAFAAVILAVAAALPIVIGLIKVLTVSLIFLAVTPMGRLIAVLGLATLAFMEWGLEGDILGEKLKDLGAKTRWLANVTRPVIQFILDLYAKLTAFVTAVALNWENSIRATYHKILLESVTFYEELKWMFTVALPRYIKWLAQNWANIFIDLFNFMNIIFENMWTNVKRFFENVWNWLNEDKTDWKWTSLLEGFESTLEELPIIASRHITNLELELGRKVKDTMKSVWEIYEEEYKRLRLKLGLDIPETPKAPEEKKEEREEKGKERRAAVAAAGRAKKEERGAMFISIAELARKIQISAYGEDDPQKKIAELAEKQLAAHKKENELAKKQLKNLEEIKQSVKGGIGVAIT